MQLITVGNAKEFTSVQTQVHCAALEAGAILFFPQSPIAIPSEDLYFLLNQQQTGGAFHKNIAYRPATDRVTGFAKTSPDAQARLLRIMRNYSQSVVGFLTEFLAPYEARWHLDFASYRPQAEESRQLALRQRNDLLHTDAFPTRPTNGDRILRFFNNINPEKTRDWVTGGTFEDLIAQYATRDLSSDAQIALPRPASAADRVRQAIGKLPVVHSLLPRWARSPYDAFMMDFHNFLKENADYQAHCGKQYPKFPPGSSWMVYTDAVAHAVLAGQFALEQTFLVRHDAMVAPEHSPLRILERLAGGSLA